MVRKFKIWDQGNDGSTMGIRVATTTELKRLAPRVTGPDLVGRYSCLSDYLKQAETSSSVPHPYTRIVSVIWLNSLGYATPIIFPGRTFVVTYTGNQRLSGGYASQGYVIVDANGFANLGAHHRKGIEVEYVSSHGMDSIVVMP